MKLESDRHADAQDADPKKVVREAIAIEENLDFHTIELLFFAYREFTADADAILERIGFGRAHHRVLHFVNRDPGMTVADLLDLLQITKQSLARVLKQLIDSEHVCQSPGTKDRRQRRLFPTAKGRALAVELSRAQARRIETAAGAIGSDIEPARRFLKEMARDNEAAKFWLKHHKPPEKQQ